MFPQHMSQSSSLPLKDSIRDVARLQQLYNPTDEMLWVFFNARVLLDQPIAVDEFMQQITLADEPYGRFPAVAVG